MNTRAHLSIPPNITRYTRGQVAERFPGLSLDSPDTHPEMLAFARSCGPEPPPALAVSAYPHLALNVLAAQGRGVFADPGELVPAWRGELEELGLRPPAPELTLIAAVPVVLAVNQARLPGLGDWADLCRGGDSLTLGCPPPDTPLPYLLRRFLGGLCPGQGAAQPRLDTASVPLDINKRVDAGDLAAGVIIPAFARAFRLGGGRMVWPASGALAVPLMACLAADAPPQARELLAYLLSLEFQTFLAKSGGLVPVRADAPGFPELEEAGWRLHWPGWQIMEDLARDMDAGWPAA